MVQKTVITSTIPVFQGLTDNLYYLVEWQEKISKLRTNKLKHFEIQNYRSAGMENQSMRTLNKLNHFENLNYRSAGMKNQSMGTLNYM